jgi:hypothetical protein
VRSIESDIAVCLAAQHDVECEPGLMVEARDQWLLDLAVVKAAENLMDCVVTDGFVFEIKHGCRPSWGQRMGELDDALRAAGRIS